MTTELGRLKRAYVRVAGVDPLAVRFYFNGRRVRDRDTPEMLGMEQSDAIVAYLP
jgi:hypothetical protein